MTSMMSNRVHSTIQSATGDDNKWLVIPRKLNNPALRLFCFCHAGGSAAVFHNWPQLLPDDVEVCAIQLPGRGHRICEALIDEFDPLVEAICDALLPVLDRPFAFFGHSMGAILAFEVAHALRERGARLPVQLLASGCRAPHIPLGRASIHHLEGQAFIDSLRELNGTPDEALNNSELMEMMEPMLRADFKVIEQYCYQAEGKQPLPLPIAVFGGLQDSWVPAEHLQGWHQHTASGFWHSQFPGDHFYYLTEHKALLRQLTDLLSLVPHSLRY